MKFFFRKSAPAQKVDQAITIHAGLHKTGSTTIQHFLSANRQQFLDQYGIYIPAEGHRGLEAHHNLSWELRGFLRFEERRGTWEDLYRECTDYDNILISSEDFCSVPADKLAPKLERYRSKKILFYFRRQDDLLASAYSQQVKSGRVIDTPQRFIRNSGSRRKFKFGTFFQDWAENLGKENIALTALHKSALEGGDLLIDFVSKVTGYQTVDHLSLAGEDKNPSPSREVLDILRYFAWHLETYREENIEDAVWLNSKFFAPCYKGIMRCEAELGAGKFRFSDKHRRKIMERYRDENAKFAKQFLDSDSAAYLLAETGSADHPAGLINFPADLVQRVVTDSAGKVAAEGRTDISDAIKRAVEGLPLVAGGREISAEFLSRAVYD